MNKLFLAVGFIAVLISLATAATIWGARPVDIGDSEGVIASDPSIGPGKELSAKGVDDPGMKLGGGPEVSVYSGDSEGKAIAAIGIDDGGAKMGGGSEVTVYASDSCGKGAECEVKVFAEQGPI